MAELELQAFFHGNGGRRRGRLVSCLGRAMVACVCLSLPSAAGGGQESNWAKKSVRLSDASRPATVKVNMMNGSIRVRGDDRRDVVVETRPALGDSAEETKRGPTSESKVEEEENVVSVQPGLSAREVNLYVPAKCSLKLACVQAGEIVVENVEGEIEAGGLNGSVRLLDVAGVALVHTVNGQVKVTFQRIRPDKAMSFTTLNGDIDVTLPANTKATVKLETLNGSIHSDFEILPEGGHSQSKVKGTAERETPFVWPTEKVRSGTINGGGPEFRFQAFNGTIHLRKQ